MKEELGGAKVDDRNSNTPHTLVTHGLHICQCNKRRGIDLATLDQSLGFLMIRFPRFVNKNCLLVSPFLPSLPGPSVTRQRVTSNHPHSSSSRPDFAQR